ncbi:MAG: cell division protein FtsA [bacterium]
MIRNISVGIDLGTHATRVVIGEFSKGEAFPKIIGVGEAPTLGVRRGYVVNFAEAVSSLKRAIAEAEKTSGVKVRRAYVAASGVTPPRGHQYWFHHHLQGRQRSHQSRHQQGPRGSRDEHRFEATARSSRSPPSPTSSTARKSSDAPKA